MPPMRACRSSKPLAGLMSFSFRETPDHRRRPAPPLGVAARLLDVMVAIAVLTFFAPLMILVAAAVFAESGRPIFFSQVRLGQRGRHFRMHKFRKFHGGCAAGRSLTMEGDPRLTNVGGFLARTKLDELPQLWNVLKGEMSIVGPRPESLDFRDCFRGPHRLVLEHKPGIFGPSQVFFRNEGLLFRGRSDPEQFYRDVLFPLKAQIDLAYFAQRTLFRDIAWAVRGALAVCGWSSLPLVRVALVEEATDRSREGRAGGCDVLTWSEPLSSVGRQGVVQIARDGGGIAGAGSDGFFFAFAGGGDSAADQAPESATASRA
jgi:lipopolysaccharide/colanic/teichoic acid biosynthesis glycosyltransferase